MLPSASPEIENIARQFLVIFENGCCDLLSSVGNLMGVSAFVIIIPSPRGVTGMSERSEEFRGKAALCERMAQQTQDPGVRRNSRNSHTDGCI